MRVIPNTKVRLYAKKEDVAEQKALAVGMAEKAKEFTKKGSEIYQGGRKD